MKPSAVLAGVASLFVAFAVVAWISGAWNPETRTTKNKTDSEKDPAKEEINSNPFDKPDASESPKIEVGETTHNFGVMPFGVEGGWSHDFVVKNVGKGVLRLAKGPSTCQCTMSDLASLEVPAGESTVIKLTWEPTSQTDAFQKSATIWTNDLSLWEEQGDDRPGDGAIKFTVEGKVFPTIGVEPDTLSFGNISETEPTPLEAHVYSQIEKSLTLAVNEEKSSPFISDITFSEISEEELRKVPVEGILCGYKVTALLHPEMSLGQVRESFMLESSEGAEITVNVLGNRQGPFVIAGPGWSQSAARLNLGRFSAGQGARKSLFLYTQKQDVPFEIALAGKSPEWLDVEVGPVETIEDDDERVRSKITIGVPAGRPPERVLYSKDFAVTFKTNRESMPEFTIYVVYESQ